MKELFIVTAVSLLLVACGVNKPDNLLDYKSGSNDDYTYITIEDKVYVPFTSVDNGDRGEWIGIVDKDENYRIYEFKDYSSDEWIISFYNSGEMDISMLMKEQNVTEYPDGVTSEYEWNNSEL